MSFGVALMPSDGDAKRKQKLRYEFAPLPAAAIAAVGAGELSYPDLAILAFLYLRRNYESMQAIVYLDQLAEAIGWTLTLDALQKRLRRLRSRGWIAYAIPPGRNRPRYEIALFPKPTRSEAGPSVSEVTDPSRSVSRNGKASVNTHSAATDRSMAKESNRAPEGPSLTGQRPSRKPSVSADHERDSARQVTSSVRAPQNEQKEKGNEDERTFLRTETEQTQTRAVLGGNGVCGECGARQRELRRLGSFYLCAACYGKRRRAASADACRESQSGGNPDPLDVERIEGSGDAESPLLEGADRYAQQLSAEGLSLDQISDEMDLPREIVERLIDPSGAPR